MSISIIIPTLNESGCLAETLRSLRQQQPGEIVVVDGGSSDGTLAEAHAADRWLSAPRGRASQMNAGAAASSGDVLLFLHADCRLEEGALLESKRLLRRSSVAAGCFRMSVQAPGFLYRCIERAATARVRMTGLVYGDQGLFLRRDLFERVGGFPNLKLMEDVRFSQTLRHHGRIVVAQRRIAVSARRWQRTGVLRQTLRNWTLLTLANCGVHPDGLAAWYPNLR